MTEALLCSETWFEPAPDAVAPPTGTEVRPAELADAHDIVAMHERCSATSLQRRFHAPVARVTLRMARQLALPTGGWSLVAQREGQIVALACAAPVSAGTAEVGLLVEDRHQGQGLGSRLLHSIAASAAARGYSRLHLLAQPDNDRVLRTVKRAGLIGRVAWRDALLEVSVPLRACGPDPAAARLEGRAGGGGATWRPTRQSYLWGPD